MSMIRARIDSVKLRPAPPDPWDIEGPPESWPADVDSFVWSITQPASIPASVARIQVTEGRWAGAWRRRSDRPGFAPHWTREGDEARWMAEVDADREYRAGRVEIGGVVSRRGPTAEDLAWKAGFDAALECEGPCEPPETHSSAERAAFLLGLTEGAAIAHACELARLDDLELQALHDHGTLSD